MRNNIVCFVLILLPFMAFSQTNDGASVYPKNYFRNPLDIPMVLAGNFGECRPGHFHSGLDIKTLGEENQPVHAAADGYISRIKMEKGGFGHALYITHPNGYTTLYAHLNDFVKEIQDFLRAKQYEDENWQQDISLSPGQFPVTKGQQIAWSGNTGSSTAPHLHFEIRNTKTDHPLNAGLFGFSYQDHQAAVISDVAIYSGNVYEDSVLFYPVAITGDVFKPIRPELSNLNIYIDTIRAWNSKVGIGINVDDFMDSSTNTLAPHIMRLYCDGKMQTEITLDDIGYDESRYVNAYADYKTHELNGKWFQCLFKLPGNKQDNIYTHLNPDNGRVNLADGVAHLIKIEVTDVWQNTARLVFYLRAHEPFTPTPQQPGSVKFTRAETNEFKQPDIKFTLDERELYDDIYFTYKKTPDKKGISDRYQLHHSYIPLHHYFELFIKPHKPVPQKLRGKVAFIYNNGKDDDEGTAGTYTTDGWCRMKTRNFGEYHLAIDTTPPTVKPLQKMTNLTKETQINFEAKDDMTSVRHFDGYIDGKWVCFEQKGSLFFYKFDEHCPEGKHRLTIKAEDENGNSRHLVYNFTR